MQKLPIDLKYLVFAWQDESPDSAYYLDSDTGSVFLVQRDLDDLDDLKDEIELYPRRFLYVPKPDRERLELDLTDFIYTVGDQQIKAMLETALEGPNKFRDCKTIMSRLPGEVERFEKWRNDAASERVRKWLAAHDLEAE
jgi:hypothetical protein